MAPILLPLLLPSSISRDTWHSASLTLRTTTLLKSISTFLQPRNSKLPSPPKFAKILTRLTSRQTTISDPSIIPTTYGEQNNSPSPGTIVGIVLGSVGGFLLLLWLLYTCFTMRRSATESTFTEDVTFRENSRRRSHNSRRSSRPHSRRVSTTEKVEIRRQRSRNRSSTPVRVVREEVRQEARRPPPVERVVVEERRPPPAERVVVEERREVRRSRDERRSRSRDERSSSTSGGNSDEVVVIEEHDPPRRSKSKRERRNSGFRTVDPLSVAGVVGGEARRGERRR
ncbi:hypothetical protein sscle_04g039610 [Sclerotinia sclerotiorum 1980 UF-70]|uniref:Uncharacterized protein n=2 Tax=Sclerotinia sclerotiorum (strain ATCC 18683 / 1980 / Ss-1) TaxID=665079 RepID=A0A1D9Q2L6_SCLS1|nr:hypothetical protein sscle_04g039610 [Sclerotinia sclerotiorum 1980 UF-70]